jgi:hypothetical protein
MMRRMPTFVGGIDDLARLAALLVAGFGALASWLLGVSNRRSRHQHS